MNYRLPLSLLLAMLLSVAAMSAAAQEEESQPTTRTVMAERLTALKGQLNLSDYEWTQVEQILKTSIRERMAIARRYGLEGGMEMLAPLEGSEMRALKRELKDSRKDTEKRMKRYLDKEQYKAFEALQEDIYAELLERAEAA